ncbi:MAG TPA: DUF1538 domain-containing protein [Candidatus Onthovivens sp.]|nr:DUF1538 domain-containing protein [Candidatus Onthovivens sp.]
MHNRYLRSFGSSCLSIIPIIILILIISLTGIAPLDFARGDYYLLLTGMVVLILGLTLFQVGADNGLSKVGEYMGKSLSKQKNIFIVVLFSIALGALIACAEPSILIVAEQVSINSYIIIGAIALGAGIFVTLGILRIFYHKPLKTWYLFFYLLVFLLTFLIGLDGNKRDFLPFIFDSGGVTTGSATVPFILALGAGVATVRGGKTSASDSFGLVGMASIGPILTMTTLLLITNNDTSYVPTYQELGSIGISEAFIQNMLPQGGSNFGTLISVLVALLPIVVIFFIYELIFIKLPKREVIKLLIGFLVIYFGLVLFLTATAASMTPIGYYLGMKLGLQPHFVIIIFAFVVGLVTILCEPAVHVLTSDIEKISDGRIKKNTVLLTLAIGVGLAICLASIRTIYDFSIMYYLVPGYAICLGIMFICPNVFTAMGFDSGATASGPMASSFVLPLIVGLTTTLYQENANYYKQAFGLIAMITLIPIITIQILGVYQNIAIYKANKVMSLHAYSADDAQIIHFN